MQGLVGLFFLEPQTLHVNVPHLACTLSFGNAANSKHFHRQLSQGHQFRLCRTEGDGVLGSAPCLYEMLSSHHDSSARALSCLSIPRPVAVTIAAGRDAFFIAFPALLPHEPGSSLEVPGQPRQVLPITFHRLRHASADLPDRILDIGPICLQIVRSGCHCPEPSDLFSLKFFALLLYVDDFLIPSGM